MTTLKALLNFVRDTTGIGGAPSDNTGSAPANNGAPAANAAPNNPSGDTVVRGSTPGQELKQFEAPGSFTAGGSSAEHVHGPGDHHAEGTAARSTTRFETATWDLKPPPAGLKTADIDANLATAYPKGTSFKGVTAGSEEERRVKYATFQISPGMKPNTTANVLVPDVDGKGTPGRVTVTTDKEGKATAELVGKGAPVPATKFKDIDEAKQKLQSDFGIKDFKETGGATWSKEELEKVYNAFSKMDSKEREALKGVTLERASSNATAKNPDRIGHFTWSGGYDSKTNTASRSDVLSLDDRVFEQDKKSFSGTNEPASYRTILHEAGHAVETHKQREALWKYSEATQKYNDAIKNKAPKADIDALRAEYNAAKKAYDGETTAKGSKTLSDFSAYVKKNKIENPTDYAGTNPADFFAESYMLYKTDPTALQTANPLLYDYFKQGKHL